MNFKKGDFPLAEEIAETCISLPISPVLKTEEVEIVCDTIKKFFKPVTKKRKLEKAV